MCNLFSSKKNYCPLKIAQNTAIIVKKAGKKLSTPLVITAIHRLTMQSQMFDSLCSCFVCLTGPYKFVYLVLEQFTSGSLSTILSY